LSFWHSSSVSVLTFERTFDYELVRGIMIRCSRSVSVGATNSASKFTR